MTDADGLPRTPPRDPTGPAGKPIADRDGGVTHRLVVRCRSGAAVLGGVGALCLLVVALRSWGLVAAAMLVVGLALLGAAVPLAGRARIWSAVGAQLLPATGDTDVTIGAPRPLSPGVAGAPVKRKLGASVLPVHRVDGPQPGGGALIVHARVDGAELAAGAKVSIWQVGRRGLLMELARPLPDTERPSVGGRFALKRNDGLVFLGTSRVTDTW